MRRAGRFSLLLVAAASALLAGCRQDMHDQPKYQNYEPSSFFEDGRSERPPIDGTVARGHLDEDPLLFAGKASDGSLTNEIPVPVTSSLLERGRERYNIYCTPCHDRTGSGGGMIVLRGYKRPPTFHSERLRMLPAGYFFNVITNGFGVMPSYRAQVPPADRWAIVAYLRALQRSQNATVADLPASERAKLGLP